MTFNKQKGYDFVPIYNPSTDSPYIRTVNSTSSRLEAGGMFFKSREIGPNGNRISLEFADSTLTVRNTSNKPNFISYSGSGNGKIGSVLLRNTKVETIQVVAISPSKFSVIGGITGNIGEANVGQTFKSDVLIFRLENGATPFQIGDTFSIVTPSSKETFTFSVPDPTPADVRAALQSSSIVVSLPPGGSNYYTGPDADNVSNFSETFMAGADGLPENAVGTRTGPGRALIHLNYAEDNNGYLTGVNKMYEWVGNSPTDGSWQDYY